MEKLKSWFFEEDGQEEPYVETKVDTEPVAGNMFEQPQSTRTSEAVRALSANKDSHLILFEPRAFAESPDIANYLKQKRAAVVNLHRLQKEQQKRVVDFLSGVIFAIDGDIQEIGPRIFLCTPKNIGVAGSITVEKGDEE